MELVNRVAGVTSPAASTSLMPLTARKTTGSQQNQMATFVLTCGEDHVAGDQSEADHTQGIAHFGTVIQS